jgi:hypothetical protein
VQREFVLPARWTVRLGLEQLEGRGEVSNRFVIRRPLHGLVTG